MEFPTSRHFPNGRDSKRADQEEMKLIDRKAREAVANQREFFTTYRLTFDNKEVHHMRSYGKFYTSEKINRMYGVAWDSTEEVQTEPSRWPRPKPN